MKIALPISCSNVLNACVYIGMFWSLAANNTQAQGGADQGELDHFEKVIRPLLVKHCYECHSHDAKRVEGGLYLDSRPGMLTGGDSGTAMLPGHPDQSSLIAAVRYESFEMPPKGKLPEADIQALTKWIQRGAHWPDEPPPRGTSEQKVFDWKERQASHWAWQPLKPTPPPEVKSATWPQQPLDRFILSKLESEGLVPATAAAPNVWLRRVYFDLIGLPPSPEQLNAFLADNRPDARERVVEELLNSPRFGEKWARHWMDLVRYGETYGHEFDYKIPHAYQYRDYLIRALNADVPYDQFVREQIAGDLLDQPRTHPEEGYNESVIGTGFWYLGEAVRAPTHVLGDLSIRIENQIDVFSRAFLGLSVACARCHDHKFDAISKEDYYAIYGILNSSHQDEAWLDPHGKIQAAVQNIDRLRDEADAALKERFLKSDVSKSEYVSSYTQAAFNVLTSLKPADSKQDGTQSEEERSKLIREVATASMVDPGVLTLWVNAYSDDALKQQSHPLFSARELMRVDEQNFATSRQRIADQLSKLSGAANERRQQSMRLSFDWREHFDQWQTTGHAFELSLGQNIQGLWTSPEVEVAIPGTVSSRRRSTKLRGALRSPNFVLQHPHLHYRIRAKGATVRLVVENYFMDQHQPLLFNGMTRKNIDTEGEWKWVTQSGDLRNYQGARAYLEILDYGDGFAEIGEIELSQQNAPPVEFPSYVAKTLADDSGVTSRIQLADRLGLEVSKTVQSVAQRQLNPDSAKIFNWMLRHRLIDASELSQLQKNLQEAMHAVPSPVPVMAMVDGGGLDEPVHIRGSDDNFGPVVPRRFLNAIAGENQGTIKKGSGRRELAERLTAPENPLFSRVIVNRLWHHLFGTGIVPSVDDFGVMGQEPSHPELLDALAADFQHQGYSIKGLLRSMVLSATYGMSSSVRDKLTEEKDPDNRLLHRMSIRRLPAESMRDAMLMVSGRLDLTMYGPGVPVHLTEFMSGRGRPGTSGPLDGNGRRSIYQEVRRNFLPPMMLAFDMPSPFSCMGRRAVSNVPAQSLILMNDPFVVKQAELWSQKTLTEVADPQQRMNRLFEAALGRPANDEELIEVKQFLSEQAQQYGCDQSDPRVWSDLCHMILNTKEFLFLQ